MSWYTAKSEEQLQSQTMLTPGKCRYEVISAKLGDSASGNKQLELVLDVTDMPGKTKRVWDYLSAHPDFEFKIRHFAYSCGLGRQYEANELSDKICANKTGYCEIVHQTTKKGQYAGQVRSAVKDYIFEKAGGGGLFPDDDIPFGNPSQPQEEPPAWTQEP